MSVIKKDWDDKLVLSKVDGLLKTMMMESYLLKKFSPKTYYLMKTRLKMPVSIKIVL